MIIGYYALSQTLRRSNRMVWEGALIDKRWITATPDTDLWSCQGSKISKTTPGEKGATKRMNGEVQAGFRITLVTSNFYVFHALMNFSDCIPTDCGRVILRLSSFFCFLHAYRLSACLRHPLSAALRFACFFTLNCWKWSVTRSEWLSRPERVGISNVWRAVNCPPPPQTD
jgi:hypothetical protein